MSNGSKTPFFSPLGKFKRSLYRRKLMKQFGNDVDLFIEKFSKPNVLSLYREWIRELNRTLPLALREVSKQVSKKSKTTNLFLNKCEIILYFFITEQQQHDIDHEQNLRTHFEATKDDYSPYLILNELEAGRYALELWKKGDRHALKYGIPRQFSVYRAIREQKPPDSNAYRRYTPFLYSL